MIYTELTKKAQKLMYEKHQNQVDKAGLPYCFHPLIVAEQMNDEISTTVALLHDIVEDTDVTFKDLEDLNFPQEVIECLKIVTHNKKDDYETYIKKISTNPITIKVKLADLKHNMDLTRLSKITDADLARIEKYKKYYTYLSKLDK